MTEHTPGPWAISGDYGLFQSEIVAPNAYRHAVASVWTKRSIEKGTILVWPEGEANARLIAAAPELYDACVAGRAYFEMLIGAWRRSPDGCTLLPSGGGVVEDIGDDLDTTFDTWVELTTAALAAAKGQEP